MLRIAKLTDYAIVVLAHLAREAHVCVHAAPAVSEATGVPQPTVEKVLKQLARGGLLVSSRGIHGGYALARDPSAISVAQVIDTIEGPVGLTACSGVEGEACADEGHCQVSGHWSSIHDAVRGALEAVSILELSRPAQPAVRRASASGDVLALRAGK